MANDPKATIQNEEEKPDTERTDGELDENDLASVSGGTSFGVLLGGTSERSSFNYTKIGG